MIIGILCILLTIIISIVAMSMISYLIVGDTTSLIDELKENSKILLSLIAVVAVMLIAGLILAMGIKCLNK